MAEIEGVSRWEHFPHRADMGIRGMGPSLHAAFEQTALAMTAVITSLDTVEAVQRIDIACSAPDDELLLVDWLNALLYEMDTRRMLFSRFEVRIKGGDLSGSAWGELVDVEKHTPAVEVKAATYTELAVVCEDGGWMAQCIVDV
jgi:tRNA nucleotidyltransferase (CCA-adding enzyme)